MTKAVKAFYEAYPYPTGLSEFDAALDPARLLGDLGSGPALGGQWQVLEAGCGCGLGLIAVARRNPQIRFTGVDINQVGISQAQQQVAAESLNNIRFVQSDLMTLEGMKVPEGGFHLIYSFGVLHHLSDPVIGLKNLARLLASQGVIACMVYGRYGRDPLQRLVDVIQLATAESTLVEEKLQPARLLADIADTTLFKNTPWEQTSKVDDIEFADRCLHVNEQSYDIDSLWQLVEACDLQFSRWLKPDDWAIDGLIKNPEARGLLQGLSEKTRYQIIERLFYRPRFELLLTHADDSVETVS